MGDHQHGDAGVCQLLHQLQDLADHFRVQRTGRLVKQDHIRVHCQRTGNCDTLLLAAGQALGVCVCLIRKADTGQQFIGTVRNRLLVLEFEQAGGQLQVLFDGQMREQVEMLEHHAHLLPHSIDVGIVHLNTFKLDAARGGDLQPVQAAQKSGLTAAGRADQADHIAPVDIDVDAAQNIQRRRSSLGAALFHAAVGLGQTTDFQDLIGHFVPASSQACPAAR